MVWEANERSEPENLAFCWLRSVEWAYWPLFLSQPVAPLVALVWPWPYIAVAVYIINFLWAYFVRDRFVSVALASYGALFARLKWLACPLAGYLLFTRGRTVDAAVALLWPVIMLIAPLPEFGLLLAGRRTEIGKIQSRFMAAIGYKPTADSSAPPSEAPEQSPPDQSQEAEATSPSVAVHTQGDHAGELDSIDKLVLLPLADAAELIEDHPAAISYLSEACKRYPANPRLYYLIGSCYYRDKQYNESMNAYKRALEIDPDYILAYDGLSLVCLRLRRYPDAIDAITKVIEAEGNREDSLVVIHDIGCIVGDANEFPEAAEYLPQVVDLLLRRLSFRPDDSYALRNLEGAYNKLGRLEDALAVAKRLCAAAPDDASSYRRLGDIYEKLGRIHSAIESYSKATELEPTNADYHRGLGDLYQLLGYSHLAVPCYDQAIANDSTDILTLMSLEKAYLKMAEGRKETGDIEGAVSVLREGANKLVPDLSASHLTCIAAITYRDAGREAEGVTILEEWVRANSESWLCWSYLASFHRNAGRLEQAIESFMGLLRVDGNRPENHVKLGEVYLRLKRSGEAADCFRAAIRLDPRNAEAHVRLAEVYLETNFPTEALSFVETALQIDGHTAEAHRYLGNAYRQLNRLDDAERAYEQAVATNPNDVEARVAVLLIKLNRGDRSGAMADFAIVQRLDGNRAGALFDLVYPPLATINEADA